MTIPMILLPLFVLVALTFALLLGTGYFRITSVSRGETVSASIALGQEAWPIRPTLFSRAFQNQFEMPLLFYVLVILAMITRKADVLFVIMEWIFVALRILHAGVHTTTNDLRLRFGIFAASTVVLAVMWIIFALRILAVA